MRMIATAGVAWAAALRTSHMYPALHYAATNPRELGDTPVEPPAPVAESTGLPPTGPRHIDFHV